MAMTTLQALIFDVDGTLADTEDLHRRAFNAAFRDAGLKWRWGTTQYSRLLLTSGGRERIFAHARRHMPDSGLSATALDEWAGQLHERKSRLYRQLLAERPPPLRRGIMRLLDEADGRGLRLAIATSSSRQNVSALLRHCGYPELEQRFAAIVTGDTVPEKKPAPAVYRRVLEELRLPAGRCIAIEDTQSGNTAALAAGLRTVITVHRFTRAHEFQGASLVLNGLGEPGRPFRVLTGNAGGHSWVSLELLERIAARDAGGALPRVAEPAAAREQ